MLGEPLEEETDTLLSSPSVLLADVDAEVGFTEAHSRKEQRISISEAKNAGEGQDAVMPEAQHTGEGQGVVTKETAEACLRMVRIIRAKRDCLKMLAPVEELRDRPDLQELARAEECLVQIFKLYYINSGPVTVEEAAEAMCKPLPVPFDVSTPIVSMVSVLGSLDGDTSDGLSNDELEDENCWSLEDEDDPRDVLDTPKPDGARDDYNESEDREVDLSLPMARLRELQHILPRNAPLQEVEDTLENETHGTGHSVQWLLEQRDWSSEDLARKLIHGPATMFGIGVVWMDASLRALMSEHTQDPWSDPTLMYVMRYDLIPLNLDEADARRLRTRAQKLRWDPNAEPDYALIHIRKNMPDRICPHPCQREGIVRRLHIEAHQGYSSLSKRVMSTYWWNAMREDIRDFVDKCTTC